MSTSEVPVEVDSNLNPVATVFVKENPAYPCENPQSNTQALVEPSLENVVTTCTNDQPSPSSLVVKSLFEPLDFDEDATLLKTKFDPGGISPKHNTMEINEESGLPEHVHSLFTQTFEQANFPIKASDGLKQLLLDYQDTFASSSSDLGFCDILQHDIDTGNARPI